MVKPATGSLLQYPCSPRASSSVQVCACFPEFLQNFSERQILWSLYLVVFLPFTMRLPIQTSLKHTPVLVMRSLRPLDLHVTSMNKLMLILKASTVFSFIARPERFAILREGGTENLVLAF